MGDHNHRIDYNGSFDDDLNFLLTNPKTKNGYDTEYENDKNTTRDVMPESKSVFKVPLYPSYKGKRRRVLIENEEEGEYENKNSVGKTNDATIKYEQQIKVDRSEEEEENRTSQNLLMNISN